MVKGDPHLSPTQIERKGLGLSRGKITRLLGEAGYQWKGEEWKGPAQAPTQETLPLESEY